MDPINLSVDEEEECSESFPGSDVEVEVLDQIMSSTENTDENLDDNRSEENTSLSAGGGEHNSTQPKNDPIVQSRGSPTFFLDVSNNIFAETQELKGEARKHAIEGRHLMQQADEQIERSNILLESMKVKTIE